MSSQEEIIENAKALCEKFINKVKTGKARSIETYIECKTLLKMINQFQNSKLTDEIKQSDGVDHFH